MGSLLDGLYKAAKDYEHTVHGWRIEDCLYLRIGLNHWQTACESADAGKNRSPYA